MTQSSSNNEIAFVREEDAPRLPPPASQAGVIGWLWRNIFSSMSNFSTPGASAQSVLMILLTLFIAYFGVTQIWEFLSFTLFDAAWTAPDGLKGEACRTENNSLGGIQPEGWAGACYPFISAKWKLIIYGSYDTSEIWRVDVVYFLGALGVGWLIAHVIPRRRIFGAVMMVLGVVLGIVLHAIYGDTSGNWLGGLMYGDATALRASVAQTLASAGADSWLGSSFKVDGVPFPFLIPFGFRVGVQILMGIGLTWILMPDQAPRRLVGMLMLVVYPLVAFLLLTGGDMEVDPVSLAILAIVSAALVVFAILANRGLLGEVGGLLSGVADIFGKIGLASVVIIFLASDIFVDAIEAASGHAVTEREEQATDWWGERLEAEWEVQEAAFDERIAETERALDAAENAAEIERLEKVLHDLRNDRGAVRRSPRQPNSQDLADLAQDTGVTLDDQEQERLRSMSWRHSFFGAASGPGARQVWPLPPVATNDWGGLLVTLVVSFAGIVFSFPLGVILAIGRRSKLPIVRMLSTAFIEFWRGVPLIYVLFMTSVMLPFFLPEGVTFNKLLRALVGVMFFNAAYQAEVVRGGLQALPKGQYEGAMALGLPYWRMLRLIILPQALTLVIPGIVNTMIALFKDTSLVLIISLFDLLNIVHFTALRDNDWASPVQAPTAYIVVAAMFFAFCFGMSRYSQAVERELRRGRSR